MKTTISVVLAGLVAFTNGAVLADKPQPQPSPQPFQHTQIYNVPSGTSTFRQPLLTLPENTRLVLEFVSFNIDSYVQSAQIRAMLEASDGEGVCSHDPAMRHVLQNPQGVLVNPTKYSYNTSQVFRMYVEQGQTLCLHLDRGNDTSATTMDVHLTGQFEQSNAP